MSGMLLQPGLAGAIVLPARVITIFGEPIACARASEQDLASAIAARTNRRAAPASRGALPRALIAVKSAGPRERNRPIGRGFSRAKSVLVALNRADQGA